MTGVDRGVPALRSILREETFDLRELRRFAAFRRWLARLARRWRHDAIFRARVRIRRLRRSCPELRSLESRYREAIRLYERSAAFERLRTVERELAGVGSAVANLQRAADQATGERSAALLAKRQEFLALREALRAQRTALTNASDERRRLDTLAANLQRLKAATGLDAQEAALARLLRQSGRQGGRSGRQFERTVEEAIRSVVLPELAPDASGLRVLRSVRLRAARVEFDLLVVRRPARGPVEVLAAVEAKRNINDLAHGFRRRQEDLAWLTGHIPEGEAASFRTKTFPTGRFDREVIHRQDGKEFAFAPDSFRRFRRDPRTGQFLDRLYLVTRRGPVWGVSSSALSRINA